MVLRHGRHENEKIRAWGSFSRSECLKRSRGGHFPILGWVNCPYKPYFREKMAKQSVAISANIGGIRPNSGSRQMYLGELVPKISVSARDLNPEIKISKKLSQP